MVETLRSYSSEKGHADWNPKLKNDELLTEADYWDEPYAPPAPVNPNAPTWEERNAVDFYGKDYSARKMDMPMGMNAATATSDQLRIGLACVFGWK